MHFWRGYIPYKVRSTREVSDAKPTSTYSKLIKLEISVTYVIEKHSLGELYLDRPELARQSLSLLARYLCLPFSLI